MIALGEELLGLSQQVLWHGFLVFLRVGASVSLLPAFGEQTVPIRVKLGLAFAFTMIVAPTVDTATLAELRPAAIYKFVLAESFNGLVLGIAVRMFVFVLQTAGAIAAQTTSLSQLLGNSAAEPLPAIGHVLVVAGLALAVTTGLHLRVAEYLVLSYAILEFGNLPSAEWLSQWGVSLVARTFGMAFQLAAPFVIVSALYNLTLGVINRAMPQLMVAFVGAPVITLGGLMLLALVSPIMLAVWIDALNGFLAAPGAAQ